MDKYIFSDVSMAAERLFLPESRKWWVVRGYCDFNLRLHVTIIKLYIVGSQFPHYISWKVVHNTWPLTKQIIPSGMKMTLVVSITVFFLFPMSSLYNWLLQEWAAVSGFGHIPGECLHGVTETWSMRVGQMDNLTHHTDISIQTVSSAGSDSTSCSHCPSLQIPPGSVRLDVDISGQIFRSLSRPRSDISLTDSLEDIDRVVSVWPWAVRTSR